MSAISPDRFLLLGLLKLWRRYRIEEMGWRLCWWRKGLLLDYLLHQKKSRDSKLLNFTLRPSFAESRQH